MKTMILLPAYNVSTKLSYVLKGLIPYKERTVFVDDGSTDKTVEIIQNQGFICLQNNVNQGVSKALWKGLKYAKDSDYDSVIIMDADGQHDPRSIPEFEDALKDNDLVIGNRFHSIRNVLSNKLASNMIAVLLTNRFLKTDFKDISCGYKAFHLDMWIFDVIKHSNLYSFIFDVLIEALSEEKNVASVNIECIYNYEEFQYTKTSEIISYLNCLKRYLPGVLYTNWGLKKFYYEIEKRNNFFLEIDMYKFWGFYIHDVDGYIVQTDPCILYNYFDVTTANPFSSR